MTVCRAGRPWTRESRGLRRLPIAMKTNGSTGKASRTPILCRDALRRPRKSIGRDREARSAAMNAAHGCDCASPDPADRLTRGRRANATIAATGALKRSANEEIDHQPSSEGLRRGESAGYAAPPMPRARASPGSRPPEEARVPGRTARSVRSCVSRNAAISSAVGLPGASGPRREARPRRSVP